MMLSPDLLHDAQHERTEYIVDREAQLGRWRADIASMESQVAESNLVYRERLIELKQETDVAGELLEKLKVATGGTWEELKPRADQTWDELSASLEEIKKALR
jgi:hypothetical protein